MYILQVFKAYVSTYYYVLSALNLEPCLQMFVKLYFFNIFCYTLFLCFILLINVNLQFCLYYNHSKNFFLSCSIFFLFFDKMIEKFIL